jgi:subtilisin family serine protease
MDQSLVRHGVRALAGVSLCVAAALAASQAAAGVAWRTGGAEAPRTLDRTVLRGELAALGAREDARRVVVHFARPLAESEREALALAGVRLQSYLGGNAYFATLASELDPELAVAVPALVDVRPIAPERKLHPDLADGTIRPWSIVERPKAGSTEDPIVAVYVLFHRDADVERVAPALLRRYGGTIRSHMRSIDGVVAHLPASRVRELAAHDAVMYVEPPLPEMVELNDDNRPRVGADVLQEAPYGLDGSGVTVLVYDGGKMFAHGDFAGRLTIGASDTASISDHATHVGGTIGGSGAGSSGQFRGMAPGVDIVSYGFQQPGGLTQGFLYTDPGDLEADYTEAITVYGADVSNNSIGTNTASNGFPCSWEGNYGATGALIDAIARGAVGEPFRIVWANGNERSSGACGTQYNTTAPPACAKNHITVGALHSNSDAVTSFTSWGPCDDGRLKPDVSAPGCQSGGDSGVTSTSSSGGYNTKCGTSMASPTVCGVTALLLEQFRQSFPSEPDPRNATLKAILATTAEDIVRPGPDYQSGYGSVRAVPAVELIADGRFVEGEVGQDETYAFLVIVGPDDDRIVVTLAWDDPPGTPNVDPVLVNDLDLRVLGPTGTTHWPWTLDPGDPNANAVRTTRDGVNNLEQVVIDAPAPGAYRVEITGFHVAEGPTQSFGAAASPTLIDCAPAGVLTAGVPTVACESSIPLVVVDCDLNTDDGAVETVAVTVSSDTEPAGETVVLVESAPESAAFAAVLPVSATDGPGTLQVAPGDTITVTYVDADDGAGGTNVPVVRTLTADCTPPTITSVEVTSIQPRSATAAIGIDEPARLVVPYGETCGSPTGEIERFGLLTSHTVPFQGLSDDTSYAFRVEASDAAGNVTIDDNGGACYTFTTPEVPEFFTEQFANGIDLEGLVATFTPNGSNDFYALCVEPLGAALPTDPAGGTDSGLGDDQPTSFALSGGAVSLYGQSYTTVHVGPNGYLTFGAGDSDYTESFADHFDLPRVSALFDDLNPGTGGSVSWKQLADRVAVTWLDVPEYSTSNSNTFQIEMFFDGRIRLSWLDVDNGDAVVGLSAGAGLDPDFFASDVSQGGSCTPTPPTVEDVSRGTHAGMAAAIALAATDDGEPAPGALIYRIESLPLHGRLTDAGSGRAIETAPYDLVAGGSELVYTPYLGYAGADTFTFVADDGGVPPTGGPSNVGVATLSVGGVQTIHEFLMDDTDPGWTATGEWEFGPASSGGSHAGDPSSAASGANVYGYDLGGDYDNDMGEETLTTAALDLSLATGVVLEFRRWLGIDAAPADKASIQVSTNGTVFHKVWIHGGAAISETAWSTQAVPVSFFADGRPAVRFRWVMGETDGSSTYPGWNIDDVRVRGALHCAAEPGEVQGLSLPDRTTLTWEAPGSTGGTTPYYDVLRSSSPSDFTGAACVESDDGADTAARDTQIPAPGETLHYLVRAENGCGGGTAGTASATPGCAGS